jgi:serine/threonine-protein kinase
LPGAPSPLPGASSAPPRGGAVPRWAISLGVVALLFGAGYLIAAEWLFRTPAELATGPLVEIPELVGMDTDDAQARVERLELEYTVRASVSHPQAPEGVVLAQSPLPGQLAKGGAPISVTLSRGPEIHVLPDVSGLSERQALIVLERLGFAARTEVREAQLAAGRSITTRPEAGTELAVPAEVVLIVSSGPAVMSVPDLTGLHIDDVAEALEEAGLSLGAITGDPFSFEAPGRVVSQYPPSGYQLRSGGIVEVRVAGDAAAARGRRRTVEPDGGDPPDVR